VIDGREMSDYFELLNKKEKDRYLHKLTCADLSSHIYLKFVTDMTSRPVEYGCISSKDLECILKSSCIFKEFSFTWAKMLLADKSQPQSGVTRCYI